MANAELDQLMEQIRSKYAVEVVPLKVADKVLKLLQIQQYEEYVLQLVEAKEASFHELPFWAKVWESSLVLSYFLGKQPVGLGRRILEIGAGIGVVGIYAALCGHRITITDINEDALLFARANALLNDLPHLQVERLDWNAPLHAEPYDLIVGSEVVYDRPSYPMLVSFLRKALAPQGMVFLAKNEALHTPAFFSELTKDFEFKQTVQTVRSDGEAQKIGLFAIRRKAH